LGIDVHGSFSMDMMSLMKRKNKILETQRKGIAGTLDHHNVTVHFGHARIIQPGKIMVETLDQSLVRNYDRLIIATGTRPLDIRPISFDLTFNTLNIKN